MSNKLTLHLCVAFCLLQYSALSVSSSPPDDEELLNCTRVFPTHVLDALSAKHSSTSTSQSSMSTSSPRMFPEPYLHECFRVHAYDVSQLPVRVGRPLERVQLQYMFVVHRVVEVSALGALTITGSLELHWRDRLRRWNATRFGVSAIHVPASEVLVLLCCTCTLELLKVYMYMWKRCGYDKRYGYE